MNEALITEELELQKYLPDQDMFNLDILALPVEAAQSLFWNRTEPSLLQQILGGMLRNLLRRTIEHVPFYRYNSSWNSLPIEDIRSIKDLFLLPVISKDSLPGTGSPSRPGIVGFRQQVISHPQLFVPDNLQQLIEIQEKANPQHQQLLSKYHGKKILEFRSGGSQGNSTVTYLTYLSVEMEAYALARCLQLNGFQAGQSIACFYNEEHKGGLQLERAADIMNMPFHSKRRIFDYLGTKGYINTILGFQRALAEGRDPGIYAREIRVGIRDYIKEHHIEVIESVQPPLQYVHKNVKGNALAFMAMYEEDPTAFASVKHIFLTGFPVPPSAYERLRREGKIVSTTWGSTEAMALATHPFGWDTTINNLVATPFPTVGIMARYAERSEAKPRLYPVSETQPGLLLVTSLLGAGSTYINYLIGDLATPTAEGFTNIHRISQKNLSGSCAADALTV